MPESKQVQAHQSAGSSTGDFSGILKKGSSQNGSAVFSGRTAKIIDADFLYEPHRSQVAHIPTLDIMLAEPNGVNAVRAREYSADSRNLRIHRWISTLPSAHLHDRSGHGQSSSMSSAHSQLSDSAGRADSPLLGFTPHENASHDPLHRPSSTYIRRLPEETNSSGKTLNKAKDSSTSPVEAGIPSVLPHNLEDDIYLPPSFTRSTSFANQVRYPARLSLIPTRPAMARYPSLPVIGATPTFSSPAMSQEASAPCRPSRSRCYSTIAPPPQAILAPSSPLSTSASFADQRSYSQTPVMYPPQMPATPTMSSAELERQKLDALVIASGLVDEDDKLGPGLGLHSSSSQIYLGNSSRADLHPVIEDTPVLAVPQSTLNLHDEGSNGAPRTSMVSPRAQQLQEPQSPRTSSSIDEDEFDEDASFYGKDVDQLFSPYPRPTSASSHNDVQHTASRWSLSSSVDLDQGKNDGKGAASSLKNQRHKLKSFINKLSGGPSSPASITPDNQSPVIANFVPSSCDVEQIHRQQSHSNTLGPAPSRISDTSQLQGIAYGSWESVPPTPTTIGFSSTTGSSSYSPVTPSDNGDDADGSTPNGQPQYARLLENRVSTRFEPPLKTGLSINTSSSVTWSAHSDTSVANSPIESVTQPPPPLKHSVSAHSLKHGQIASGFKGFVSRIGLTSTDVKQSQDPPPTPRSLRERMMNKNNSSTLSLRGLAKGNKDNNSKPNKPKRRPLVNDIEKDNARRYEAMQTWYEGFSEVVVNRTPGGSIVADITEPDVANAVCRLHSQVQIKGAGSVQLSRTTAQNLALQAFSRLFYSG
ncbi:hypothetical protein AX17_005672 [Amanita inopinata Kibby_2008]|nr:hypothetical protein AX17_005672 [Amanita inopinata Kibby_2008]